MGIPRASWWMGAFLGVPLAIASRAGRPPKLLASELFTPVGTLLAVMALAAGLIGYVAASNGRVWLVGRMAEQVPADRHVPFLADLWAHNAAYSVGFVGGFVLCGYAVHIRKQKSHFAPQPLTSVDRCGTRSTSGSTCGT